MTVRVAHHHVVADGRDLRAEHQLDPVGCQGHSSAGRGRAGDQLGVCEGNHRPAHRGQEQRPLQPGIGGRDEIACPPLVRRSLAIGDRVDTTMGQRPWENLAGSIPEAQIFPRWPEQARGHALCHTKVSRGRSPWELVAVVVLSVGVCVIALLAGGGRPVSSPVGLPDPGHLTGWSVRLVRLSSQLAAVLAVSVVGVPVELRQRCGAVRVRRGHHWIAERRVYGWERVGDAPGPRVVAHYGGARCRGVEGLRRA